MKMLSINTRASIQLGFCTAVSILILFSSCVSKTPFLNSSAVPAARGFVKVKKDDNQNYLIQVSIDYLAEAKRLDPPKELYVIWMESDNNTAKNIGQINRSSNPNKLKADFNTSSSFAPTQIYITAENDATVSYPGSQLVLTTGRLKN